MTNNIEKTVLSKLRRAVDGYAMIQSGDKIAVGLSGGKDSVATLTALAALRRFYPCAFELVGVTVDSGFPTPTDFSSLAEYCRSLGVPYVIEKTDIYKIVFEARKEDNPCSLCASLRRGAILKKAKALGCNKVAFGHHLEDVTDTFLMNILYSGQLHTFQAVTEYADTGMTLIRPMFLCHEQTLQRYAESKKMPVVPSACPENKKTERETVKAWLNAEEKAHRGVRHRIMVALEKNGIDLYHSLKEEENG